MNFEIEKFKKEYKSLVVRLIEELGGYLASIDNQKLTFVGDNYGDFYYKKMISEIENSQGEIFVALVDQKIVGFVGGFLEDKTLENSPKHIPHKRGVISNFFVGGEYRNLGIGTNLLEYIENYFRDLGCNSLYVNVFAPNERGYDFYKRQGFIDRSHKIFKKI